MATFTGYSSTSDGSIPNNRSFIILAISAGAGASPEAKLVVTYTPFIATTNYLKKYRRLSFQ